MNKIEQNFQSPHNRNPEKKGLSETGLFVTNFNDQSEIGQHMISLLRKGRVGLVMNLDGTLSSLETNPSQVKVSPGCRQALATLEQNEQFILTAVISGRSADQTRQIVEVERLTYLGNYGMEVLEAGQAQAYPIKAARPYASLIKSVLEAVIYELSNHSNASLLQANKSDWQQKLFFENKGVTAAIHYAQCENPAHVRPIILGITEQLASKAGLRVRENEKVVEIYPPIEVTKGTALRRLSETYQPFSLICVGNDLSDLEAFYTLSQLEQEKRQLRQKVWNEFEVFEGVTIAVNGPAVPLSVIAQAHYVLDGVQQVEHFLSFLASLTSPGYF